MGTNGITKSTIIWIVIVVIIVAGFMIFNVLNKEGKVEYFLTTANAEAESTLFNNYTEFQKFIDGKNIKDTMENRATYKKLSFSEKYNEEFFKENKLAVVVVYEDTTKDYIYSIDKVAYNEDKTEATITYTYKYDTFADTLSDTWYDYMFVDLDNTVEHVNFVRNTDSE